MSRISAIAFDLDGTLIDSAPDIALALNAALTSEGLQRFDLSTVRSWIGDGPDTLIGRALNAQGLTELGSTQALRLRLRQQFDVATLAAPLSAGKVYEGILPLLHELHGELPLIAVTNKPTGLARAVLDAAQLLPMLNAVWGADAAHLRKPAPAMLLAAASQLQLPCAALLMVGDSPADMQAASAAGCPCALVEWGYGAHAVSDTHSAFRASTPQVLLEYIHTHTGIPMAHKTLVTQGVRYANGG
jgi:phosphoglycolate phosphatase